MKKRRSRQSTGDVSQNSPYDKIWRENMQAVMPGIIKKILGIDITHSEDLPHKIQITRQKEVDHLKKVTDTKGDTFILHLEIQTTYDPMLIYRMLEYRMMVLQVHRLPVRQYVIYLGEKVPAMALSIDTPDLKYECNFIALNTIPYRLFLSSPQPEEKILAVLGDFGGEAPEAVLCSVVSEVANTSEAIAAQNRYLQQLRIFVQLRNLAKEFNKIMEAVSSFFKEEKDPFFIKGESQGLQRGLQKGLQKGKLEGKGEVVRNLLRSGRFTISEIADFAGVDEAFINEIAAAGDVK